MLDELRLNLGELGLTRKEADVYLAMLELGAESVQRIAEKAGINRTTAYLIIDSLKARGLVSDFEKGKKALFAAENPHRFMSLIVQELTGVQSKQDRLEAMLPKLLAIFNAKEDKPVVRFFEGSEALRAVRLEAKNADHPLWEVFAVDEDLIRVANVHGRERIENSRRGKYRSRALMAIKPGCVPPYFDRSRVDVRVMDYTAYPFAGDLTLVGNKLFILTNQPHGMGVIIEHKEISDIFRALYEAAWSCATAWVPPADWEIQKK